MSFIPNEVLEALKIFRQRVGDIEKSGFTKSTTSVTTNLFPPSGEYSIEGYDEDYLRSFLVTLRQFILNDQTTNFGAIHNKIQKYCPRDDVKRWIAYARELWYNTLRSSPIKIYIRDKDMSLDIESILDLFLYTGFVHSNLEKTKKLESLPSGIKEVLILALFTSLVHLVHALYLVRTCINSWLDGTPEILPPFEESIM